MENWKPVPSFEGIYDVSDRGKVKSLERMTNHPLKGITKLRERLLKQKEDEDGYKRVTLSKNGKQKVFLVHRLVASAFLVNPLNLPEVDHEDKVRSNNFLENLSWIGTSEHRRKDSSKIYSFISPEGKIVKIKNLRKFCIKHSLNENCMYATANGRQQSHKGWRLL